MSRITFIGVGLMGRPMAENLAKAGHQVTVWNRSFDKAQAVAGAIPEKDLHAAVAKAEVIFTMVSDGAAVMGLLQDQGLAQAMPKGALFIDTSSIDPKTARAAAALLAKADIGALDAPVSGGPSGAISAKLAIMVGGDDAAWRRGKAFLEVLGTPTWVGPAGAGQVAKLANQAIVGLAIGAVSEALFLAKQGGADPAAVRTAMTGGFADSLILQIHGERMLERTFLPGGPAAMHLKDMRNIMAEAQSLGLDLPLSRLMTELFEKLAERYGPRVDHSGILLEIERRNPGKTLNDKKTTLP